MQYLCFKHYDITLRFLTPAMLPKSHPVFHIPTGMVATHVLPTILSFFLYIFATFSTCARVCVYRKYIVLLLECLEDASLHM
jgi:hypothetical protein